MSKSIFEETTSFSQEAFTTVTNYITNSLPETSLGLDSSKLLEIALEPLKL